MLDNIDPKTWGPAYWKMLHYMTFAYPDNPTENDKTDVINFFKALQPMLPCQKCRNNFNNHLKKFPLDENALSSKLNLIIWLINIHNEVNIMTGKKVVSYDDVIKELSNEIKPIVSKQTITFILLIFLVVVLIIFAKLRN
jgi:hypothetical protein